MNDFTTTSFRQQHRGYQRAYSDKSQQAIISCSGLNLVIVKKPFHHQHSRWLSSITSSRTNWRVVLSFLLVIVRGSEG